jgi:hypothetical protein
MRFPTSPRVPFHTAVTAVLDAGTAAVVSEGPSCRAGQAWTLIDTLGQQDVTIADDVAAVEAGKGGSGSDSRGVARPGRSGGVSEAEALPAHRRTMVNRAFLLRPHRRA